MAILHGSWISRVNAQYFFVWGETWRTTTPEDATSDEFSSHPFCLNSEELLQFMRDQGIKLDFEQMQELTTENIAIPSERVGRKKQYLPIFSENINFEEVDTKKTLIYPWKVQGIRLDAAQTIQFLQQLPLGFTQKNITHIGADLRYWTHIFRWIIDLITRGKFLAGIAVTAQKSYWYPLLDSTVDQARLAKFSQHIPDVCVAYINEEESENTLKSQESILAFLRAILDQEVRQWIEGLTLPNKGGLAQTWLQSLVDLSGKLPLAKRDFKRLDHALDNWTLSIQNYLVTPDNNQLGDNQFRICLVLQPPTSGDVNWGYVNWKLNYCLQALDNPEILIDSATIFQATEETITFGDRTIDKPQESLLKGLGLASRLYAPIAESLTHPIPTHCELDPIQVYEFIKSSAWQLQDKGLGVILPDSLASGTQEKRLGIKIEAKVSPKKGEHLSLKTLLNYNLKLMIGEQAISQKEFNQLLAQKSPLVEVDGEWIVLQPADVKASQAILDQSYEVNTLSVEDALRFSIGDDQTIAKLPIVQFEASGVLQELLNNLTNNQSIQPIEHPQGFKGELRPYQTRGVGWLAFLEKWGLGACLADDMGLGKTPQLLAFLLHLKEQNLLTQPTLVVCPTSVLNNWEREVKKFAPRLSTLVHHGDKRSKGKDFFKNVKQKDLVITSYPLVYRDSKTLEPIQWQGIVLDEAQNIKNSQAKQSQAVRQLKTGFRIALTGTPVENRLSELWSILDFLNPGFLGTKPFFQRRFATPIEKFGDQESLQILRSLVRPFILRRLKTDKSIIQDLPEKQEMNIFCGLSTEQGNLYQNLVDNSLAGINDATGIQRRGLILTLLLKLKQICNHPAQFLKENTLQSSERSGKLLRLEEMLEEVIEEGDRALIFTQFAEWGKLLQPYLNHKFKREILFLYGATRRQQRQEMIDRFQNDPSGPPIFILSLKAGGTGLNLTRANHVFHVDRWWNPAVENQATDRAFRIGQKQNVQVHKFVCTGTLEEKINDMLESKSQLAEQTVDAGENWLTELDSDQLRNLLLLDRDAIIDE